jgi:hypothetical protein
MAPSFLERGDCRLERKYTYQHSYVVMMLCNTMGRAFSFRKSRENETIISVESRVDGLKRGYLLFCILYY